MGWRRRHKEYTQLQLCSSLASVLPGKHLFPNTPSCHSRCVHMFSGCVRSVFRASHGTCGCVMPYDDCVCSSRVVYLETSGQHNGMVIKVMGFVYYRCGCYRRYNRFDSSRVGYYIKIEVW